MINETVARKVFHWRNDKYGFLAPPGCETHEDYFEKFGESQFAIPDYCSSHIAAHDVIHAMVERGYLFELKYTGFHVFTASFFRPNEPVGEKAYVCRSQTMPDAIAKAALLTLDREERNAQ